MYRLPEPDRDVTLPVPVPLADSVKSARSTPATGSLKVTAKTGGHAVWLARATRSTDVTNGEAVSTVYEWFSPAG